MRVSQAALAAGITTLLCANAVAAQHLREDSFKWFFGVTGGALIFETQTQTHSGLPTTGIQALIMAKRAALQISIEESFGSNEMSAFGDPTAPNGSRDVSFDRIRKYSAILMAFPVRAKVEPYLGVGWGILHTVNTEVQGFFTSPFLGSLAEEEAKQRGSTGFGTLLGGVQGRITPSIVLFGQYQITTSPSSSSLLVGPSHSITAGLRFSLGSAKEGIQGGGY